MFVENIFNSKPAKFYLRGINKLPDNWQEVIQNNGGCTIDWNQFVVRLLMNKLYLSETEIIYDSTQIFSTNY